MLQIGIREPGSAITHFIAMMMAIFATSPLLVKAALNGNHTTILAMAVFMGSMVLLYGASTVYHSLVVRDKILKIFRKLDHMMIFVLIAGSYTPVCLIVLGGKSGYTLLAAVWLLAGGLIYTVGGVIYALKLPVFNAKHSQFGSHEVFHLFVMAGSICHFVFMYQYVA